NHTIESSSSSAQADQTTALAPMARSYGVWLVLTIALLLLGYGHSYVTLRLDGRVANTIRADVFAAMLRQSPRYFHEHDAGRLMIVVNQFCTQVEMALRQMLVDPI